MNRSFYTCRKVDDSKRLYVMFTGMAEGKTPGSMQFMQESGMFEHNVLLLRQPNRELYHGVISKEIQGFTQFKKWLVDFLADFSSHEIVFVGISEAAYSAIVYAHYLKPEKVYAFSPSTKIDVPYFKKLVAARAKKTKLIREVPCDWSIPSKHLDLRKLLASHNGVTSYKVFYCIGNARDPEKSDHIASMTGVSMNPQEGTEHIVVHEMKKRGLLKGLFEKY